MEQGIHLVDIFSWFLGKFSRVTGFTSNTKWPIAPLEDNGFALLQTDRGRHRERPLEPHSVDKPVRV